MDNNSNYILALKISFLDVLKEFRTISGYKVNSLLNKKTLIKKKKNHFD